MAGTVQRKHVSNTGSGGCRHRSVRESFKAIECCEQRAKCASIETMEDAEVATPKGNQPVTTHLISWALIALGWLRLISCMASFLRYSSDRVMVLRRGIVLPLSALASAVEAS